jgi:hypothetical protein
LAEANCSHTQRVERQLLLLLLPLLEALPFCHLSLDLLCLLWLVQPEQQDQRLLLLHHSVD